MTFKIDTVCDLLYEHSNLQRTLPAKKTASDDIIMYKLIHWLPSLLLFFSMFHSSLDYLSSLINWDNSSYYFSRLSRLYHRCYVNSFDDRRDKSEFVDRRMTNDTHHYDNDADKSENHVWRIKNHKMIESRSMFYYLFRSDSAYQCYTWITSAVARRNNNTQLTAGRLQMKSSWTHGSPL